MQQTVFDMITMSIQIVPIIDNYITGFISLDKSIPRIFTQTKDLLKQPKVSKIILITYNKYIIYKQNKYIITMM